MISLKANVKSQALLFICLITLTGLMHTPGLEKIYRQTPGDSSLMQGHKVPLKQVKEVWVEVGHLTPPSLGVGVIPLFGSSIFCTARGDSRWEKGST